METQAERKQWLIKEIAFIQEYWMESSDPERIDRREKYGISGIQQGYRAELRKLEDCEYSGESGKVGKGEGKNKQAEVREKDMKQKSWYGKDLRECSAEEQDDVVETVAKMYEKKRMTRTQTIILIKEAARIIDVDRITDIVIGVYEKYTHHKKKHRTMGGY